MRPAPFSNRTPTAVVAAAGGVDEDAAAALLVVDPLAVVVVLAIGVEGETASAVTRALLPLADVDGVAVREAHGALAVPQPAADLALVSSAVGPRVHAVTLRDVIVEVPSKTMPSTHS